MTEVGVRAAKEIYARINSGQPRADVLEEVNLANTQVWMYYKKKNRPSSVVLRRMALAGYDIHYILTGERK